MPPNEEVRPVRTSAKIEEWLKLYGADRVNVADLLCDSHPDDHTALLFEDPDGNASALTYGELASRSKRLAGSLRDCGVVRGAPVAVMMAKSPDLLVSLLAIWRLGGVHVPLFTAFGPEAIQHRLRQSGAEVMIADATSRAKLDALESDRPTVFCRSGEGADIDLGDAIENGPEVEAVGRGGAETLVLLFTSGTTGDPKAVPVPIRALASFRSYMEHGLSLKGDDVYWNLADPGWAYGLYFGVIGPLLLGRQILWRGAAFDPLDTLGAIVRHRITNLAGAPTVFRALRAAGVPSSFRDESSLRVVSSAGEPLNAELLGWSESELGVPIHDHYGQSELGMAVYFSHDPEEGTKPVPESMGRAAPGYRAVILDERGDEVIDVDGELAIDVAASPQYWFGGYHLDAERTAERFRLGNGYYLTGDSARRTQDGLLFYASRADDVITTSGYRVGPFEVESALLKHPAVSDVAVIGTPDELRGEAVTAIVVTTLDGEENSDLARELQGFVKVALAKHLYPRRIAFVAALPKTPSGKVQRRLLRERWDERDDVLRIEHVS
jgi:acetyl-CoA synthetase